MNQYLKTKKHIQFDGKDLITPKIHRVVSSVEYGSLETFIHDRKVVSIKCRKKIRFSQHGVMSFKISRCC